VVQAYTLPEYFQEDWLNEYFDYQRHREVEQKEQKQQQQQQQQEDEGQHQQQQNQHQQKQKEQEEQQQQLEEEVEQAEGGGGDGVSDVMTSDYRFVYLGPAGSWTGAHADVLRSYSWSANVCGKKR
jgi:transcription termination factor Rho